LLAIATDSEIKITARILSEENASTGILKKNGFVLLGTIWDEEDGNVWEWEYKMQQHTDNDFQQLQQQPEM
jgi:[ribosomal protein S5]-alanine N-acetyltransferase